MSVPQPWGTFGDSAAALQGRDRRGENRDRCAPRAGAKLPPRLARSRAGWVSPLLAGPSPILPRGAALPSRRLPTPPPPPPSSFSFLSARPLLSPRRGPAPGPPRRRAERRGRAQSGARRARAGPAGRPGFQRPRPIPAQPAAASRRSRHRAAPPALAPRAPAGAAPRLAEPSRGRRAREAAAAAARSPGELAGAGPRAGDLAAAARAPLASGGGAGWGTTAGTADKALSPHASSAERTPTCAAPRPRHVGGEAPSAPSSAASEHGGLGVASRLGRDRPGVAGAVREFGTQVAGGGGRQGSWRRPRPTPSRLTGGGSWSAQGRRGPTDLEHPTPAPRWSWGKPRPPGGGLDTRRRDPRPPALGPRTPRQSALCLRPHLSAGTSQAWSF